MSLFHSVVLGIIQGIGEFLPISSSAHLIIIPWFLNWDDGGLTFDVALHAGTLIALLIYFRTEWINLLLSLRRLNSKSYLLLQNKNAKALSKEDFDLRLTLFILIATIPGAMMGLALEKKAESAFRNPGQIAINLAIMGIILWLCDRRSKKSKALADMTFKDALVIGISQGFAVIPGVSRAGITISTALLAGLDRESAARFSFFLSMPIIAGACVLKLRHLTGADLTVPFLMGILAAAVAGYFAISGLIRYLQTRSYGVFAAYRVLMAAAVWIVILNQK
jgi:undecaprenyl-diphosphatase